MSNQNAIIGCSYCGNGECAVCGRKIPDNTHLIKALKLQKALMNNLMKKGNVNWGNTFDIDFGLMNEALIGLDVALAKEAV